VPMLVPGATASVRQQLEGWFAKHQIAPVVVGEFDDAALLKAFGREGQRVGRVALSGLPEGQWRYLQDGERF